MEFGGWTAIHEYPEEGEFFSTSATHGKIAVIVDQSLSVITAKLAHGVARGRAATDSRSQRCFRAQLRRAHWSGPEAARSFLSFFVGFRRPNLITGLSRWRTPD